MGYIDTVLLVIWCWDTQSISFICACFSLLLLSVLFSVPFALKKVHCSQSNQIQLNDQIVILFSLFILTNKTNNNRIIFFALQKTEHVGKRLAWPFHIDTRIAKLYEGTVQSYDEEEEA